MDDSSDGNALSSPSSVDDNKDYLGSHGTTQNTDKVIIPSSCQLVNSTNDASSIGDSENNNQIVNIEDECATEHSSNAKRKTQNRDSETMQSSSKNQPSIDNTTTNDRTATSDEGKCNDYQKIIHFCRTSSETQQLFQENTKRTKKKSLCAPEKSTSLNKT